MSKNLQSEPSQFLLYTTPDGKVHVEVYFKDETVWLTQKKMAELFECSVDNVSLHLKNIFKEGELEEKSVIEESSTTAADGKAYKTKFYNLDAIIAVGYRVNSKKATQFRIWATKTLREYIIKGFAMDDERLKNGAYFGKDYFQELLERVRSIRASERRIYLKITDIFQECSIDYDPNSQITKDFFAAVQNKFHFAITGQTAAEIIHGSADKKKPFMGLKTWKNSPNGRVLSSDVTVAKNYLPEKEIKKLERTVSAFFDYIENVIENRNTFTMAQFAESVDKFLSFHEFRVLENKGSISAESAKKKALAEYQEFNKKQVIENDFEREVLKKLQSGQKDTGC
jgi:hypothetical protein